MPGTQIASFSRIDREDPTLVIEDLVVRYGALRAVEGVSLKAWAGQVTAVLGPNGAGKTSTIEVCEGIRRPSSGWVRILGLDPVRDRRILRPQMGVMLQEGGVYPSARPLDTIRQYCGLYKRGPSHADPEELLERVGLMERRNTQWRRLSGGEKQRLSLAMTLAARPRIAFLDEPTSGVDVNGRTMIRGIIRELAESGSTVILATHELEEAEKVSDRVAIFDRGRLLLEGPLDSVRRARRMVRLRTVQPITWDAVPPDLISWLVEESPGTYIIEDAPTDLVAKIAVWLDESGIEVIELRTGISTLEDVFKRLTGVQ